MPPFLLSACDPYTSEIIGCGAQSEGKDPHPRFRRLSPVPQLAQRNVLDDRTSSVVRSLPCVDHLISEFRFQG
jgi:hypothetical protein